MQYQAVRAVPKSLSHMANDVRDPVDGNGGELIVCKGAALVG
jgi:hypothetical protein